MRLWRGLNSVSRNESSVHDHADAAGTTEEDGSENGYVSTKNIVSGKHIRQDEKSAWTVRDRVGRAGRRAEAELYEARSSHGDLSFVFHDAMETAASHLSR